MRQLEKFQLIIGIGIIILFPLVAWSQVLVEELTCEWAIELGETYTGTIETMNVGAEASTVEVWQSDYFFFCDGHSEYPSPGELPRSNADWIALGLSSPYLTIPAKSSVPVSYTVQVPNDATLTGTYWSVVIVRVSLPGRSGAPEQGIAIHQVIEYVIQIITHIGDTGVRNIGIIGSKLVETDEGYSLQVDIENTGERWVRPEAWAELYDENGAVVGRFESPRQRIYPGCSVRHRFPLVGILGGKYKALVIFDNGDEYVWGAQYDLEL